MSRPSHIKNRYLLVVFSLPLVVAMLVLGSCQLARSGVPPQGSLAGGLRGYNMIILQLPQQAGRLERITVSKDHTAVHVLTLGQQMPTYNEVLLPDNLWQSLDTLRSEWCENRPTFRQPDADDVTYEVAIRCTDIRNAEFRFSSDQIPPDFIALINTFSPAP